MYQQNQKIECIVLLNTLVGSCIKSQYHNVRSSNRCSFTQCSDSKFSLLLFGQKSLKLKIHPKLYAVSSQAAQMFSAYT